MHWRTRHKTGVRLLLHAYFYICDLHGERGEVRDDVLYRDIAARDLLLDIYIHKLEWEKGNRKK